MMLIEHICKPRKSLLLSKQNGKQGGNYFTEEVTPIHLCETLELVSKLCQPVGYRYQGLLADYTVLPVPRSLVKRFKGPFGGYGE